MTPPSRALVVVPRRIGDVLLATPLIRTLKRAWPRTQLDALVFRGTEGVLATNPDVDRVLTVAERPTLGAHLALYTAIWRCYDLALSLLPGDRPTFYAIAGGKRRIGLQTPDAKASWKRRWLREWLPFDDLDTHTVRMNLRLAEALGVTPIGEVVIRWSEADARGVDDAAPGWNAQPFAVLHPHPKFNYKKWTLAGWTELARWLVARGMRVLLSGSPDAEELAYAGEVAHALDGAVNLAGKLSLAQVGRVLASARLYCGPDTVVTHMAAALGVPTVAVYGPSNPVKWGPWPKGFPPSRNPWARVGSQRQGNVALVQGETDCVPCMLEGCERHVASYSDCLQHLPARRVIAAAEALLMPA